MTIWGQTTYYYGLPRLELDGNAAILSNSCRAAASDWLN
jgi:hypothetical protein